MMVLAQQNLVFQGPRDPAYFEESSMLIWWLILAALLIVTAFIIILIKRLKKHNPEAKPINKARDLHTWDNLINYWQQAASEDPYPLDLMIALLKQGSYLVTHIEPKQSQLDNWLNLTPQELTKKLTHSLNQNPEIKASFDIKSYLQKLNYLEHIRFNPQFNQLPQKQLLQTTLDECLVLLKQAELANQTSLEENVH